MDWHEDRPEDREQRMDGEAAQGHGERPDRRAARGNPVPEDIDVERALGKLERISGN